MRRRIVSHLVVLVVGMLVAAAGLYVLDPSQEPSRAADAAQPPAPPQRAGQQPTVHKSYGIYVGRNHTADGSVLLGGSGDEVSSHWLEIVPAQDHPPGSTISVGVTPDAAIPGELIRIPQTPRTRAAGLVAAGDSVRRQRGLRREGLGLPGHARRRQVRGPRHGR